MKVYQQGEQWKPGEFPGILAIGDSWFWYPFNNLLESLVKHPKLRDDFRIIQAIGKTGALLQDYVGAGRFADKVEHELAPLNRHYYQVFLISGAGNDAVDYGLALKSDCSNINDPAACIDEHGFDNLLRKLSTALSSLIHEIRWAYKDDALLRPIFLHGYDYSIPDGRPFDLAGVDVIGPWLQPAMNTAQVKPDLNFRSQVMRSLQDRLNVFLKSYDDHNGDVCFIDSRGILSSGADYQNDWANELHPTRSGFDKIVEQAWIPALKKYGMTK